MTKEELKKHASSIIDMLDGLPFNEQLNVVGLACGVLGYTLYKTGTLEDKERLQEILTDISKHLECIKVDISVFAPQAIDGEGKFIFKKNTNTEKEEKK